MLEALETERAVHDRHRNLVIAATGTGKTVVAALDYRRLHAVDGGALPSLLFVAHRGRSSNNRCAPSGKCSAIASFGELYVGGARPERWKHVFASVQSLSAYGVDQIPSDAFDVVIIDEFHHAEAPTYRRILDHLSRVNCSDSPRRLSARTARTSRLVLRGPGAPANCASGRRSRRTFSCPSTTSASRMTRTCRAIEWKRGRYDEAAVGGSTPATKRGRGGAGPVARQGHRRGCDAGAGLLRVGRARPLHGDVFNAAGIPAWR